jgi:molybdate transport system ATP-binding protein
MIELDVCLPLDRFPLEVQARIESEAVAVLGPSGSGKTSLLEVIAGLRPRASGRLAIDGDPLLDSAAGVRLPPERRRIGFVPQDSALFPHLDVRANVRFGLRSSNRDAERRFDEAVAILEIGSLLGRFPATLSGGERQRVALARALASAPRLLLLDEPLAALDLELRERILPYLLEIRDAARIPMVYVTHHVGEALVLAREAMVLAGGQLVDHGPAGTVLAGGGRVAALDPEVDFDNVVRGTIVSVDEAGGIAGLELSAAGFRLVVPVAPDLMPGGRATYAVPAEDLLISIGLIEGISARNVFKASITGIEAIGRDSLVHLAAGGLEWRARLTPAATRELGLARGQMVWLAIKTHAFRRLH